MTCGHVGIAFAGGAGMLGFGRERQERLAELLLLDAAQQADGSDVMLVQGLRKAPEHRLIGVGGHAVDDQLPTGDAEGDRLAMFEQFVGAADHRCDRRRERRMADGIH